MITLVLLIVLAWSFYIGYTRGLILQGFYTASSVIALIVATAKYPKLAALYYLWVPFANATEGSSTYYFDSQYLFNLDRIFYAGLAFLTIYVVVYAIMRFIGIFVHLVRFATPQGLYFDLASGVLAVIVTWISLQIGLTILATIPLDMVQNYLHDSWLANAMIEWTPFTSSFLKNLWISNISG